MVAGVCSGLGDFFKLDPTVVRVLTVLLTLVWPFTILAYLVLMFVVPEEPLLETPVKEEAPTAEQTE
jgi:phage shock protein C